MGRDLLSQSLFQLRVGNSLDWEKHTSFRAVVTSIHIQEEESFLQVALITKRSRLGFAQSVKKNMSRKWR